jgi:hypothetical protein
MAAAVSRLMQIAAQLRQVPDSLDFDSAPNIERVAGDLLLEAIELGAFSGPEHADRLNRIRRAKLCSADYRRQALCEFFGEGFRTDRPLSYGLLADAIEAEAAKLEVQGNLEGATLAVGKTGQREGTGGTGSGTLPADSEGQGEGHGGADLSPAEKQAILAHLEPHIRKAYFAFQYAQTMRERRLEDREAYDWLKEHDIDQDKGDVGELAEYKLPDFDNFRRYVSAARKPLGENKYTRRGVRPTGRSIARSHEIEHQHGGDE